MRLTARRGCHAMPALARAPRRERGRPKLRRGMAHLFYTRRDADAVRSGEADLGLECARVGSLVRVMHQPEGGPQASFDIVEPRATRLELSPLPVTSRIARPATV